MEFWCGRENEDYSEEALMFAARVSMLKLHIQYGLDTFRIRGAEAILHMSIRTHQLLDCVNTGIVVSRFCAYCSPRFLPSKHNCLILP